MVDNEEDGRITEYSESCSKLLSAYGFGKELETGGLIKRITDVLVDLDFNKLRRTRQERYMTNQIYEEIHKIDLNQLDDSNSLSHDYNKKQGNLI